MNSLANPQDLLLAYDPDFTGYTSLSSMSQPVETGGYSKYGEPTAVLGGTADPDGYYDDFTSSLTRLIEDHPLLLNRARGARTKRDAIDWKTVVIGFGDDDAPDVPDDDAPDDVAPDDVAPDDVAPDDVAPAPDDDVPAPDDVVPDDGSPEYSGAFASAEMDETAAEGETYGELYSPDIEPESPPSILDFVTGK